MAAQDGGSTVALRALLALSEGVSDGVALCRDGRILWANARLAEMAGVDRERLAGRTFRNLLVGEPADLEQRVERSDAATLCHLIHNDDEPRQVEVRCAARDGDAAAWVVADRTHVRTLEEEVVRANRELHELHRRLAAARDSLRRESDEREELLTVVSHELRTPVTVINGYNRLLLTGKVGELNEEQTRFLQESTKSCQRLNAFIGNLLEASRTIRCEGVIEVCETSLEPPLEGVVAYLKPLLEERDLRVTLVLDPEATVARFDPVRIEQVLTNLLGNAVKYAEKGGRIEIATRHVTRQGRRFVEVSIADDGPGVSESDRDRIFLPYVRAGEQRGAGGLGLGLAICRRLVEAHSGRIWVDEGPLGGCRFAFTLPAPGDLYYPEDE